MYKRQVIDYLQLVQGSNKKGGSREQEIAEISRSLKILAKEIDVPVIALLFLTALFVLCQN